MSDADEDVSETDEVVSNADEDVSETDEVESDADEDVIDTDETVVEADEAELDADVVTSEIEDDAVSEEVEETDSESPDEPDDSEGAKILDTAEPFIEEDGRAWFVVHCYSGYENKVRHSIEQRIESMGMQDKIFDVVVPTEEEIEIKDGKRRTVERRVFPGYILVQLIMDEDSWYVVRNTPGVTGFVGMGNDPTPLRTDEVAKIMNRMEAEAPKVKFNFQPGEKVRIRSGPFNDFIGTVDEIDIERAKVRVLVSFFGRETPVELDFLHVENV
jgi:transcriptional antiterminator NusG